MLTEAKKKINDEIVRGDNPYVKVVGEFLLKQLEKNPAAAEKILAENKTIMKSLDVMKKEAKKNKVGDCAVLTDEEGFAIVLDYFEIEEPEEDDFDVSLEDLLGDD